MTVTLLIFADMREDVCHFQLDHRGFCALDTSDFIQSTKQYCCCARAAAWGTSCTRCPEQGTLEHKSLCLFGPGYDVTGQGMG